MAEKVHQFSSPVITIEGEKTIQDALVLMQQKKIKTLVVSHKAHPIGIFTERDLAKYLKNDKTDRQPHEIPAFEVMNKNVTKIMNLA